MIAISNGDIVLDSHAQYAKYFNATGRVYEQGRSEILL